MEEIHLTKLKQTGNHTTIENSTTYLRQYLPFATTEDIFGVSNHDLLYSLNEDPDDAELIEQALEVDFFFFFFLKKI